MNKRLSSAAIAIPVVYLFILWGGFPFFMLCLGVITAGLIEFYNMCAGKKIQALRWWGVILGIILLINAYFITAGKYIMWGKDPSFFIITAAVIGTMIIIILQRDLKEAVVKAGVTLFGLLYVVWLAGHIVFLRDIEPFGFRYTMLLFIVTWASDIGAYYIGLNFGKRTLHIASPNKTRAGAAGAVLAGAVSTVLLKFILKMDYLSIAESIILGVLIGGFAVLGDLAESVIKRNCGCKDSGSFLPGHGGVLDRIDSLIFTVPLVYYYLMWFVL
ncbi:MAG: CDP-archaeol synthase [Elusimicrobia bacterium]|jgi:phosphatidate cytidylyltransferase|nr:CDP-archaeol synthase [Elusimicrobiota bacterium]